MPAIRKALGAHTLDNHLDYICMSGCLLFRTGLLPIVVRIAGMARSYREFRLCLASTIPYTSRLTSSTARPRPTCMLRVNSSG